MIIEITEQMYRAIVSTSTEIYKVEEHEQYREYFYYVNYMTVSKRDNFLTGINTYYMMDCNS